MSLLHTFEAFGLLLGLLLGSFLNVCIARLPYGESVVHPRSHCPGCAHPIRWYDNVPLLSWVLLRARCRDCRAVISWGYPAVELASGLWFAALAGHLFHLQLFAFSRTSPLSANDWLNGCVEVATLALLGPLLLGLIVMDWQTYTLPDEFTLGGMAAAFSLLCVQAVFLGPTVDQIVLNSTHQLRLASPGSFAGRGNVFLTGPESLLFGRLAAVVGVVLLLLAIRSAYKLVRHREGMGLGDVKLLAMIAAFLGFWPAILALFLGVLAATVYAALLLVRGRANRLTRLPFGSFLGLGGLASAVFGARILAAYVNLFR